MTKEEAYEKIESAIDTLIEIGNGVTHEDIQEVISNLREVEGFLTDRLDDIENMSIESKEKDDNK
jgi:hypothetical protein